MFPYIIAAIVAASLIGYLLDALSAVNDFQDPHDWDDEHDQAE